MRFYFMLLQKIMYLVTTVVKWFMNYLSIGLWKIIVDKLIILFAIKKSIYKKLQKVKCKISE